MFIHFRPDKIGAPVNLVNDESEVIQSV